MARVGPPLPLKPNFAIQDASKEDGQGLGKSELQVQVEVEGNGGEQETSSTQPIKFIQENNVCTIDAPELEEVSYLIQPLIIVQRTMMVETSLSLEQNDFVEKKLQHVISKEE